jgi:hypothetical protein
MGCLPCYYCENVPGSEMQSCGHTLEGIGLCKHPGWESQITIVVHGVNSHLLLVTINTVERKPLARKSLIVLLKACLHYTIHGI